MCTISCTWNKSRYRLSTRPPSEQARTGHARLGPPVTMAAVVLLLLVLLLRESAAVLEPVCLDCKGQVNCDVASTGDLVCRLPDSCDTRNTGPGSGCIVPGNGYHCIAIYLLNVTNSSTLLNYTAGTFCRDSTSNVTNTSRCYNAGTENGNLCLCDTDRCNNQVVFPGFTTPMPTPSTGDPIVTMTPNLTGMPEWLLYGKTLVCIIIILFTLTPSLSQSLSSWNCLSCYCWFYLSL